MSWMSRAWRARLTVAVAVAVVVVLGAAAAVAANKALSPSGESKAVIDDAAGQLGVTPSALSSALTKALENRLEAAVASGLITKEQAAALKQRIESGDFPLVWPGALGGHDGHGWPGHGPFGDGDRLATAASYLGLSEAQLRVQLASGKTLAQIATSQGKSVSGLVDAMVASATKRLDQAVADGKLTKDQASAIESGLREHITSMVNGEHGPGFDHPDFDGPHGGTPNGFMPWRQGRQGSDSSFDGPNL